MCGIVGLFAKAPEIEERLDKKKALAIFSSDAISSSAYATEEILRVLVLGGAAAMLLSVRVSIAIAVLLAVVALSYRQVCRAYPNGGGAYVVARTNLAPIFGLIAAAMIRLWVDNRVDFSDPRNLLTVGTALVLGAGNFTVTLGGFSIAGIGTATVAAIGLYQLLGIGRREPVAVAHGMPDRPPH